MVYKNESDLLYKRMGEKYGQIFHDIIRDSRQRKMAQRSLVQDSSKSSSITRGQKVTKDRKIEGR